MPAKKEWKPVIYAVAGEAQYKYWALAAYQDGVVTRYSRVAQTAKAFDALIGARDFAMMLNDAGLTPKQEGTTFTKRKLPAGRFLNDDDLTDEYAKLARLEQGIKALKDLAAGKTPAEPTEVPEWLLKLNKEEPGWADDLIRKGKNNPRNKR